VVATRPTANNGLGMSPLTTAGELRALSGIFRLLEGKSGIAGAWEMLVGKHLVAVMLVHAVSDILTFNLADFRRYPGITALDPARF